MNRAAISRADLLIAQARLGPQSTLPAGLLGFERKPAAEPDPQEIKPFGSGGLTDQRKGRVPPVAVTGVKGVASTSSVSAVLAA